MDRSGSGKSSSSRSALRIRDSGLEVAGLLRARASSRCAMYSLEKALKTSASSMARSVADLP
jgi:hypothetical protein